MKYGGIILAGGQGTRYKGKKQFELIDGKKMWEFVRDKVYEVIPKENVVVVGIDVPGGNTRSNSVINGLQNLPSDVEKVVIVEAARPLVTVDQIKKLLEDTSESITFALPLVNTPIGRDGSYYNRNDFYDLLTPQAFDFQKLKTAYETNKYTDTTDETIIMYKEYGIKPKFLVEGENLIKVTYQRDMKIIKSMIGEK